MREAPELERLMGMELYLTASRGLGGRIRSRLEDFLVEEELASGLVAELGPGKPEGACAGGREIGGRGSFLLCVLVKSGLDTLEAVQRLARCLRLPEGLVSFAGLKDAKAITAQFVAIRGLRPERLKGLDLPGVELRPMAYTTEPLSPADLVANRFRVVVRAIELPEGAVRRELAATLSGLEDLGGLPNFYGHQRFGTARPVTHLVGRELLRGDVWEAVELYLAYVGPGESAAAREARSYLAETGDLRGYLRLLPRGFYYERLMAEHLLRRPRDYYGALRRLPLRLRRLFVQAYQAYLFNRFLSARAREGLPLSLPEPGDWVLLLREGCLPEGKPVRADASRLRELRELAREGKAVVSLPLPGHRQAPSGGRQGELEEAIMEEEGVRPEDFKLKHMPELASPGWLRPALARLELLEAPRVREDELSPGCLALELAFRLPRGAYATAFLRELMKPPDLLAAGF